MVLYVVREKNRGKIVSLVRIYSVLQAIASFSGWDKSRTKQPKTRGHVDHLEKFPMCTPSSAFLQGEDHFETNLIN